MWAQASCSAMNKFTIELLMSAGHGWTLQGIKHIWPLSHTIKCHPFSSTCIYACIHACMWGCMHLNTCMCVHVHMHVLKCVHSCKNICVYVCVDACLRTFIPLNSQKSTCLCLLIGGFKGAWYWSLLELSEIHLNWNHLHVSILVSFHWEEVTKP